MAGRRPESEYRQVLEETWALVERLFREQGAPVAPLDVERATGWPQATTKRRLSGAAERRLLHYHANITAYSPSVDAEGRPLRLMLVVEKQDQMILFYIFLNSIIIWIISLFFFNAF
jgi:hypothetical protein